MKFGTVLLTIFFAACALGLVVWLASYEPTDSSGKQAGGGADGSQITPDGPQPRAEAEETVYHFGVSAVGQESHHIFIVKNTGDAPLKLTKGRTSCQCTVGSFDKSEVAPGESVEVKLTWTPKEATSMFDHHAVVLTNDPNNPKLHFEVVGEAYAAIRELPEGVWMLPDLLEKQPTRFTGYLSSSFLDDFEIKEVKSSTPVMSVKTTKLDKEGLQKLVAKSGFRVDLEVSPEAPLGPFNESITCVAMGEEKYTVTISVVSHREGPLKILNLKNGVWDQKRLSFSLGSFPAEKGLKAEFLLYANDMKDKELEFSDMVVEPEFLKVDLKPDPTYESKKTKRFLLTIEVPPGSPRSTYIQQNPAQIHLKTNHPDVPELNFRVKFVSR